jgi:hypothetical protein
MTAPAPPDPPHLDLEGFDLNLRPARGRDVLLLQQWFGLTQTETCYLLGLSVPKWNHYLEHPDEPLNDPTVAILVWLLATAPETRFLPTFPEPAEVLPLYLATAPHSAKRLGAIRKTKFGKTAFGLLLGREMTSVNRWLTESQERRPSPQVYRLLWVLRNLLLTQGVAGFDAWVNRVEVEAHARGLKLSRRMTSWSRMLSRDDPPLQRERRRSRKARATDEAPS